MSRFATHLSNPGSSLAARLLSRFVGPIVTPVLCYHDVNRSSRPGVVSFDRFRAQIDLLQSRFKVVNVASFLSQIVDATTRETNSVVITFDDGCKGAVELAVPELEKRSLPYTIFIIARAVRGELGAGYATLAEVVSASGGHGTLGAHSATHAAPLPSLGDKDLGLEISNSMALLSDCGVGTPRTFCYPWAAYDDRVIRAVREAGFDAAFAGHWLRHHSPHRLLSLGRVTVDHDDDIRTFEMKLRGARDAQGLWLELRRRWRLRSRP